MHDFMLAKIVDAVQKNLPSTSLTKDLTGDYSFPVHIVPTDLYDQMLCGGMTSGKKNWSP